MTQTQRARFKLVLGRPPEISARAPLGFLLQHLAKNWRGLLGRRLRPHGLSASAFGLLCALTENEAGLIQRELAERLDIEGSTLVRLLDNLEGRGLARRAPSPSDRRRKLVRITARGLVLLHGLGPVVHDLEDEILADLEQTELDAATGLLARLARRVEAL